MRTLKALSAGFKHATASPRLIAFLWLMTLLAALPGSLVIREAVKRSVGESRVHLDLERGFDMDWYSEYEYEAVGFERLLTPTSVRAAAFLDNLDAWFSGRLFTTHPAAVAMGVVFALAWCFLLGGILYRFAYYEKEFSLRSMTAHGSEFVGRFVRLMALGGALYYGVYRLARWLFPMLEEAMRDVTVERDALLVHLSGALLVLALLMLVKLTSDYAKIATVLEDRRSMLLAAWHGLRFVLRHPVRTVGAYSLIAIAGLVLLSLYGLLAPGQGQASLWGVGWALLVGQLFLAARLVQQLTTYAAAFEIYRDATRG